MFVAQHDTRPHPVHHSRAQTETFEHMIGRVAHTPRIGLALGSGSARGWAHIGVLQALEEAGIRPHVVCGTSIGALVGAAYAAGELQRFSGWVHGLGLRDVLSFMDFSLSGGVLKGERLMAFFKRNFIDKPVDRLNLPFAAVATALESGQEIWLREGSTVDAVRASIALPGLFSPVWYQGRLLVDGGLVNPVPVSLARAMGADLVIAVDLNSDILGRHLNRAVEPAPAEPEGPDWLQRLQNNMQWFLADPAQSESTGNQHPLPAKGAAASPGHTTATGHPGATATQPARLPSVLDVIASSLNIMQVRITRSRMAGEPPDLVITPKLAHLGLLDFHQAEIAIKAGHAAAQPAINALQSLLDPAKRN